MILTSLVLSVLVHFAPPMDRPIRRIDVPPNGSRTYILDDPNTEMNHSYISIKWDYVDMGPAEYKFVTYCVNFCKGEKHVAHKDCDLSCDDPCGLGIHHFNVNAVRSDNYSTEFEESMTGDGNKFGISTDLVGAAEAVRGAVRDSITGGLYAVEEKWKCWNTNPCSYGARGLGSHAVIANVTYQLYRMEKGASGALTRVNGPTKTIPLQQYFVPDKTNPTSDKTVICYCAVVQEPLNEHASIGGIWSVGDPSYVIPTKVLKDYKFAMTFENMNSFTVTATNPTSMAVSWVIEPGTECDPDNDAYQDMVTTERVQFDIAPWQTVSVTVPVHDADSEPLSSTAKGRGFCINMHKKEPNSKVKYWPRVASSSEMIKLADFTSKERFTGPWSQTRFWIATDNATMDEVNKVMRPGPSEGMYLRSLYQAATVGGIDFTKAPRKRCLEPKLIVGDTAPPDATNWFVNTMTVADANGLAGWVTKNPKAFSGLFEKDSPEISTKHAATVANALCSSSNEAVQRAGIDFLMQAVPNANRSQLASKGGLNGLGRAIMSENDSVALKALEAAEAYKSKELKLGLFNLSPKASDAVKKRAAALVKVLGAG